MINRGLTLDIPRSTTTVEVLLTVNFVTGVTSNIEVNAPGESAGFID